MKRKSFLVVRFAGLLMPGAEPPVKAGRRRSVLETLSRYLTPERANDALAQTRRPKNKTQIRLLSAAAVIWMVIAIGLWGDLDMMH